MVAEERGEYAENQRHALATLISLAFNSPKDLGKLINDRQADRMAGLGKRVGQIPLLAGLFKGAGAQVIEVKR